MPTIIEMYNNGIPPFEIAKKLNIDSSLVKYHLKKQLTIVEFNNEKIVNWILTSPSGQKFYTTSLIKFAVTHNLNHISLRRVAKSKQEEHKGWKCYYNKDKV